MDFLPAKVENSNKRKCFVCNGQTQLNCAGGRCGIGACFCGSVLSGHPKVLVF